jgi:hypothetical protein
MARKLPANLTVYPIVTNGVWESNDPRYRSYAHELLAELEQLCTQITVEWPLPVDEPIKEDHPQYQKFEKLIRLRDRTADTVQIYAAMAIEGFLNWYGVLRLGESIYSQHFERLGIIPKLQQILLKCDSVTVTEGDPIVIALTAVAEQRNDLLHPKAREVVGDPSLHKRTSKKLPEVPQEVVASMELFFEEFSLAVPDAAFYIQRSNKAVHP